MTEVTGKWDEQFTLYFNQCIADDIQNGMAPGIRREIGLKDDFFKRRRMSQFPIQAEG